MNAMVGVDENDNDDDVIDHPMNKLMLIHLKNLNELEKYFLFELLFVVYYQV
jgi:inorganic pyrophosphatase